MPSQRAPRGTRSAAKPLKPKKQPKKPKAVPKTRTATTQPQPRQLAIPLTKDEAPLKLTDKQIQDLRTLLEGIESKAMEHAKQNSSVAPPPHPKGSLTRFLFTGCLRLMGMGMAYAVIMATTAKFVKTGVFGEVQLAAAATIATIVAQILPAGTPAAVRGVVELAAQHAVTSLLSFHDVDKLPRLTRQVAGLLNMVGSEYSTDAASAVAYAVIVTAYNVYILKPSNVWWTRAWMLVDFIRGGHHLLQGQWAFAKKYVDAERAEALAKRDAERAEALAKRDAERAEALAKRDEAIAKMAADAAAVRKEREERAARWRAVPKKIGR